MTNQNSSASPTTEAAPHCNHADCEGPCLAPKKHAKYHGDKPQTTARLHAVKFVDIDPDLSRPALVGGLLDHNTFSVLYGPPGEGKTFAALDLALHVALGREWHERKITPGAVVYIAAEGGHSVAKRAKAFRLHHGLDGVDVPFWLIPCTVDLLNPKADTEPLIKMLQEIDGTVLVVIDTVSRALAGGDENGPKDMGAFVKNCDRIRQALNTHVMAIHHSGKDVERGARGHTALKAAADTEIDAKADDGTFCLTVRKQRDGITGNSIWFKLHEVDIGHDENGDTITSCVVLPTEAKAAKLASKPAKVLAVLLELGGEATRFDLFNACKEAGEFALRKGAKEDSRRKAFDRALDALIKAEAVETQSARVIALDRTFGHSDTP